MDGRAYYKLSDGKLIGVSNRTDRNLTRLDERTALKKAAFKRKRQNCQLTIDSLQTEPYAGKKE